MPQLMLVQDFLFRTAARRPHAVALVCNSERTTYGALCTSARNLAAALQRDGVRRGDRVFIFAENSLVAVASIYAVALAGAVFVPINPQTKREKLAYLLGDASPSAVITTGTLQTVLEDALGANSSVTCCFVARSMRSSRHVGCAWHQWEDAIAQAVAPLCDPGTIDQDLAAIIYTSGSTGEPKGVMMSHLNMVTAIESVSTYLGLREDDVILCALPLAFDYGLYQILMSVKVGARVILERSFAFPVQVLGTMQREQVTVFPGVPTMFSTLLGLSTLGEYDLRALRMLTNTAAALPEERVRELRLAFPGAKIFLMYGLTECKRVSYLPPDEIERRPTSVGRGMPNEEVYLVDAQGTRLPPGSTGELVVRGNHVMRGYWGKPQETARRLWPGPYPGESVLHTGDLFRMDEDGYLYFISRTDDIIKSGGEKVSPKEVESALYGIEGVLEAAVIGVADAQLGQAVKAIVVLKPGYSWSQREIIKHCLERLESHMVPKYVEVAPALPHSENGKIQKSRLS